MIESSEAFEFLRQHQPLPNDNILESVIEKFNEVRKYFLDNPDPGCVPLFLNCFGEGSGFGLYQTIEDLIRGYDDNFVIVHLRNALFSSHVGVRYWCSQIASCYEYDDLIDGLINVYDEGNIDSKCASLTALSNYDDQQRVIEIAKKAINSEKDDDLLEIARDILGR